MYKLFIFIFFVFVYQLSFSQNTVGLTKIDNKRMYPGHNLIFPLGQSNVYLLDNCGQVVHTWEDDSTFRPGNSAYILQNGNLIKAKRRFDSAANDRIWRGGGGETVELRTWKNDLLATFTLNNDTARLHHDITPLPNGNILMVAWVLKDSLKSIANGRNPTLLPNGEIWSEVVLEWNPTIDEIVWEWHAWDHLIQDFDNSKSNFGAVAEHPELINLNYDEHNGHPDWLHINAIHYNPVLDQIVLGVPCFNEFWIIDHSTTMEEAATHNGGNSGKGGDLLYRWGNPLVYQQGTRDDQQLFFQHDIQWVNPLAENGSADFGRITCFNNRAGMDVSTLVVVNTEVATGGIYPSPIPNFRSASFEKEIFYPDRSEIRAASNNLSSVQFLPNGNVLALSGGWGFAYELTPNNEIVWQYIIPIKSGQFVEQGETLAINNNFTFNLKRYAIDFEGFEGRNLSPKGYLELNPNETFCEEEMIVSVKNIEGSDLVHIYPNPASQNLTIEWTGNGEQLFQLYSWGGVEIKQFLVKEKRRFTISDLSNGIYYLKSDKGVVRKLVVSR